MSKIYTLHNFLHLKTMEQNAYYKTGRISRTKPPEHFFEFVFKNYFFASSMPIQL